MSQGEHLNSVLEKYKRDTLLKYKMDTERRKAEKEEATIVRVAATLSSNQDESPVAVAVGESSVIPLTPPLHPY